MTHYTQLCTHIADTTVVKSVGNKAGAADVRGRESELEEQWHEEEETAPVVRIVAFNVSLIVLASKLGSLHRLCVSNICL